MRGRFDRKICRILTGNGLLKEDAVQRVLEEAARDEKKTLSQILLERKLLSESAFLSAMAKETRIPPVDLRKVVPEAEAIRSLSQELAEQYEVLPVSRVGNLLTVAVSNPFDLPRMDELGIVTRCEIRALLSTHQAIREMLDKCYNLQGREVMEQLKDSTGADDIEVEEVSNEKEWDPVETMDLSEMKKLEGDSPVVRLVTLIITQAIQERASDIHIHPMENSIRVLYRIDGTLKEFLSPPKSMHSEIVTRIKVMAGMNVAERRIPQDGRIQARFEGRQIDFRVALIPTIHGERVVMRLLDSDTLKTLTLDRLGMEEQPLEAFKEGLNASYGMIMVTGPTGSGKTTTLYAGLNEIMDPEENITTVEDPVEYQLDGVNQVPVSPKRGLTFAAALRSILRQDPDIVMIGEIRDRETADIAIKAALTGHLVLSTVHTNDAAGTIPRLIDMGIDPFMVSSVLLCSSAQRLVRQLCSRCKRLMEKPPPEDYLIGAGFHPDEVMEAVLYEPAGCPACLNGYRGRFGLFEVLQIDNEVRQWIVEGKSAAWIKSAAVKEKGMLTLRRCGIMNVLRGRTSLQEVLAHTLPDEL